MDMLPVKATESAEVIRVGNEEVTIVATNAHTGGDLFAIELRMPPGGGPPVMHRHAPSEVYHVLSGEFTFYVTGADGVTARRTAGVGETVALAGNTPHTIRNESQHEAVAFCVHAPGAAMEGFTRDAAALAASGTPTMEDVLVVAQRNGIELLGPIPA